MGIRFVCAHCNNSLHAPDHKAGARLGCPACKQPVQVPEALHAAVSPTPAVRREPAEVRLGAPDLRKTGPSTALILGLAGGGLFLVVVVAFCGGLLLLGTQRGAGPNPVGGWHASPPAGAPGGSRLEGAYRRSYDDAALGVGKGDRITFSADGRFEERGFLNAALGSQVLPDGRVVFYPPQAGGQGAYRVVGGTLELTYASHTYGGLVPNGGTVRLALHPFPGAGGGPLPSMILNTRYMFVRVGGGGGAPVP
jgi:hypothetical protein